MIERGRVLLLVIWALVAACGPAAPAGEGSTNGAAAAPADSGEPVVVINGAAVSRAEYERVLFDRFGVNYLESFVEERLIEQKAKELGITADPQQVEAAVQKDFDALLRTRFSGSEDAMRAALAERGMTLEGWRKDLAERSSRDLLVAEMIKKQRTADSEAVKQRFEQKHGEDGLKLRVRHILVSTKVINSRFYPKEEFEQERSKIEADTRSRANQVLGELKGGGDFAALAKAQSDDFTAVKGGDLGEAWKGRFGKEFDAAVDKLAPGAPPVLVQSRRGIHILQVTEVEKGLDFKGSAILAGTTPNDPSDVRPPEQRKADALKKMEQIQAALKAGRPFEDVAREMSDDLGTRARGGDLGIFGRRRLGDEVDAAMESAAVPSVVGPIETGRGFWIVDLKERKAAPTKDKKLVRHIFFSTEYDDVKKRKLGGELSALAQKKASDLLARLQGGADFAALAEAESEDAYTRKTGGEYLNYRKASLGPEIWEAIQSLAPNAPPRIVESKRGYHIVQVIERTQVDFNTAKEELLKELNEQPLSPTEQQAFLQTLKDGASVDRKIGPPPAPKPASPHSAPSEGGDLEGEVVPVH